MRILGVDPGSVVTGWGVVEGDGQRLRHVANGCLRPPANAPLPEKLGVLFRGLGEVIAQHRPDAAAVEMVFVSQNVQSALKLGQARGALIAALGHHGLAVHEYTAVEIKKAVVGFGRAEKNQVQEMVRMLLALPAAPQADAADALAAAINHLNQAVWRSALAGSAGRGESMAIAISKL